MTETIDTANALAKHRKSMITPTLAPMRYRP